MTYRTREQIAKLSIFAVQAELASLDVPVAVHKRYMDEKQDDPLLDYGRYTKGIGAPTGFTEFHAALLNAGITEWLAGMGMKALDKEITKRGGEISQWQRRVHTREDKIQWLRELIGQEQEQTNTKEKK
jgi:hypothetical protein